MIQRIETLVIPIKVLIKFISRLQTTILRRRKKHESFEKKERKKIIMIQRIETLVIPIKVLIKFVSTLKKKHYSGTIVLRRTQKNLKPF